MARLIIDYSKNTAPLQKDGGRERQRVGMSLRYHEPLMGPDELDQSATSLGSSRGKIHPPNPSYPLQFLERLEKELKPERRQTQSNSPVRQRGRGSRSRSPHKRALSKSPHQRSRRRLTPPQAMITFQLPPKATLKQRRFDTQKLHGSLTEGLELVDDKSNHTAPVDVMDQSRSSLISSADTFAGDSVAMSIQTAPAAVSSSTSKSSERKKSLEGAIQKMSPPRERIEEGKEEDEVDSDDERNASSSFLPTALKNSSSQEDDDEDDRRPPLRRKKSRKRSGRKQPPSLDEWFKKDGSRRSVLDEEGDPPSIRSKTPTRSNRRSRRERQQLANPMPGLRRNKTSDDMGSVAGSIRSMKSNSARSLMSTSARSLMSSSQRSLVKQMSASHPMGPRRRGLPKRTKSFDSGHREDSNRSLASANTRRGGRRPGNRNGRNSDTSSKRKELPRSKSGMAPRSKPLAGMDSFRNLKSLENSFSFMAGSRIRIRRNGTVPATNDEEASVQSMLPSTSSNNNNNNKRQGRRLPVRTKSCEDMPSLLRSS